VLGGLFGTAVLLSVIPLAKRFVLAFSYPEFLMMAVLGLTVIAVVTDRNTFKGLAAAGIGFLLAFMGMDPITGSPRFTYDAIYLWDGLGLVPVLIGLFAGSEIVALFGRGRSVADQQPGVAGAQAFGGTRSDGEPVTFWQGALAAVRNWFLIIRASLIGVVVGVIPGVGGAVSGFLAYAHAKQSSRHPEKFGKGAVEGVIAAESANDAKEGGSLLPTVAFGIPGTVGMAILLGALLMHGVPAGPTLMVQHADLMYVLVVGMTAAKFIAPVVVWLVARQAPRLTALRPGLFTPLIAVTALVGSYTIQLEILDVVMTLVFGYIGYAMRRYGFSRVALIIALVLGELVERSYYQTVGAFGSPWHIVARPISGVLVLCCVLVLTYAVAQAVRRSRARALAAEDEGDVDGEELADSRRQPGRIVFDVLLLAFTATIVVSASRLAGDPATMPLLIGVPLMAALVLQLLLDAVPRVRVLARDAVRRAVGSRPAPVGPPEPVRAAVPPPVTGDQPPGTATAVLTEARERNERVEAAEREEETYSNRTILLRQAAFAAWALGFVALGAAAGFVLAIPVALLFFLVVIARETWLRSALVAVVTWLLIWGLFGALLGVPL
jgi:putative tricarboxylic transport membrane protein